MSEAIQKQRKQELTATALWVYQLCKTRIKFHLKNQACIIRFSCFSSWLFVNKNFYINHFLLKLYFLGTLIAKHWGGDHLIYTFSYDPAVEIEVKTNALVIGKKNTADRLKISYSSSLQYVHNILSLSLIHI